MGIGMVMAQMRGTWGQVPNESWLIHMPPHTTRTRSRTGTRHTTANDGIIYERLRGSG